MANPIRVLVQDYGWIHMLAGLIGNFAFFVGSIFFLPSFEPWKTLGVWLFIGGSFLMLLGTAGELALKIFQRGHPQNAGR